MIREFYSPQEIRFSESHILWLLDNVKYLNEGMWPPCPWYTESTSRNVGNAHYTVIMEIRGELFLRIELCGEDGGMMLDYFAYNKQHDQIAREHATNEYDVSKRIGRCLRYCMGWRRKKRSYREWYGERKTGYYSKVKQVSLDPA